MAHIFPSIFAADFTRLGDEVERVIVAGAQTIHVDIMDGHFVPNFTMGTPITESLRTRFPALKLDHHLMIEDPDTYVPIFIEAGANSVSVHYEVARNLDHTLRLIRRRGALAGVAVNPATSVELLADVLDGVDYVLVMSVNPGFGGQPFIPRSLQKIRDLVRIRCERQLQFAVEIDGGIRSDNVASIIQAGGDWLVSGSSVFRAEDPGANLRYMNQIAQEASSSTGRTVP